MRVFHHPAEQGYAPLGGLFNGKPVPYPEGPGRTAAILAALKGNAAFDLHQPAPVAPEMLWAIHSRAYLSLLQSLCGRLKAEEAFLPTVFGRRPLLLQSPYPRVRAGYYALDTSTPLRHDSFSTALLAAAAAAAAARAIAEGDRWAYSLMRPPGHHAGREGYAGYCFINNAALAATLLLDLGCVAILDVDVHHGNGTQDIFYERDDVFYASLHCRPEEAYPYVAGDAAETGVGRGRGANLNLPLPAGTAWRDYEPALATALERIRAFDPAVLIISLGFDTLGSDPIGAFQLTPEDFAPLGRMVAGLARPTLVVQEGGYDVAALGASALHFFAGLGAAPKTRTTG